MFGSKHMVYHHHNLQLAILVSPIFSVADDVFSSSQYCTKPYSKDNLLMKKFSSIIISLESDVSLKLWLKYRLIGFRIFANRGNLTPEKVSMVKTATLTLQNPLRFKARDSYPQKSLIDKI